MDHRSLADLTRCRRSTGFALLALGASALIGCISGSTDPDRVLTRLSVCPDGTEEGDPCEVGADRTCASAEENRFCWCEPLPDGTTVMQCEGIDPPPSREQCSVEALSVCLDGGQAECTSPNGGHCLCTSTDDGGLELHCTPPGDECDEDGTPEEDCQLHYERCIEQGAPEDHCEQILDACDDGDPTVPQPEECDREYEACIDAGVEPDQCEEILRSCTSEPPPPPAPDDCEQEFQRCVESGVDPDSCQQRLQACLGDDREPEPDSGCEQEYHLCIEETEDPELCEERVRTCLGTPPPPPEDSCEREYVICLEETEDSELCQARLQSCLEQDDAPDGSGIPECSDEVIEQCRDGMETACTRGDAFCECRPNEEGGVDLICEQP